MEREFECYSTVVAIQETFQEIYEIMSVDIGLAIRTASNALDAAKKIADIAIKTQNLELQEAIIELRTQLVEIKENLVSFKEENFELKQENKTLKEQVSKPKTEFELKGKFYYKPNDDRPFCPVCYEDKEQKTSLLVEADSRERRIFKNKYKCSICKNRYPS